MTLRASMLITVLALGCTQDPPRAEDPYWGKQPCGHCAMLVSETAPAAQVVLTDGARRYFDDVGCLVGWEAREARAVRARWVRTPADDGWVNAETALYSSGHRTPMGYGFLPDTAGLSWSELREAITARGGGHP